MDHRFPLGLAAALASAFIASSWQLVSRQGVTTTLGPIDLATLRYGIPALLLLPVWVRARQVLAGVPARLRLLMVLGGGLPFGLLVLAGAQFAPAAHIGIFMAGSMPLFTALGAWAFKRERIARLRLVGLFFIGCGMGYFAAENVLDPASTWRGDLLFLAAAMLWAAYSLAFASARITVWQGAALVNLWSAVLVLPIAAFVGLPLLRAAPLGDVLMQGAGQGVLAGVLGVVTYTGAVSRLGASRASLTAALVPVLTTLGAATWLGEPITPGMGVALLLLVPGIVLASGALRR